MHSGQQNNIAIWGFVLALVGLVLWPVWPVSLICSMFGLERAGKLNRTGRGLAIAGIILSSVGIVAVVIFYSFKLFFS